VDDPFGIDAAFAEEGFGEGPSEELKGEIDSFIEKVQGNEKLSQSSKDDFVGRAEKLKTDLELVKDDDDARYGVENDLMELKEDFSKFLEMPEVAQALANKYTGGDVTKILEAAERHSLDLDNLPEPPTAKVFEFLADLDSDIGDAIEDAQDAVREKEDLDKEAVRRATESSAEMKRKTSTGGTDVPDVDAFRYLSDARYFEDPGSEKVASAFHEVAKLIKTGLIDLYPDATIKTVGSDLKDADLIKFDGKTIDILANRDGSFIAEKPGSDEDLPIPEMVTLEYDWEGDGDWEDTTQGGGFFEGGSLYDLSPHTDESWVDRKHFLAEMQDAGYPTHAYDD